MGLEHGGRLLQAARTHGIPLNDWLDLSTGIHPHSWPGIQSLNVPGTAWSRLPEEEDGLSAIACQAYGAQASLPVAGTQAAIQTLPRLCKRLHPEQQKKIAIEMPSYAEHGHAWQQTGFQLHAWPSGQTDEALLDQVDALVLLQPNNPTGSFNAVEQLLAWHERLQAHGGWLIVDEAYVDATPELSLATYSHRPGLIVLRSLGKFFGLPGARVGFVLAEPGLLDQLNDLLGPWPIAGPARWLAMQALQDEAWQAQQRPWLMAASERLKQLLNQHDLTVTGGSPLFQWVIHEQAAQIHQQLARRGILVRLFQAQPHAFNAFPDSLRFGLPGIESDWQRLDHALSSTMKTIAQ